MKKAFIGLFVLVYLFSSFSFSIRKGEKLILEELFKIQEVLKSLDTKITLVETDFSAIVKKIDKLELKVSVITKSQADEGQTKENIVNNLVFLKEELNELKNKINGISDRLFTLPQNGSVNTDNGNDTAGTNNVSPPIIKKPQNTYYLAYSDYLKKNYDLAIEGFYQFLKQFPDNNLADNSLYWIGECYYSQKKYSDAVRVFSKLINEYSDGDKIPASILKKGYSLIEMGKQEEGVMALKELNSKFPLSEEAALAQQKITDIQG